MPLNLAALKRHAKNYVEIEARTKVTKVSFVNRHQLFGNEDIVLSVATNNEEDPEWWVVGGSTPMNLYSKKMFPIADTAYTFHVGLMMQLSDRQYQESNIAPEKVGYDAFISHASEDKETFVKPLAKTLDRMGFKVWYDEFELKIGDSLRRSIDKGLTNSRYGIVVLSPAFFAKNWPQYELNGLTTKEMKGKKVILPIWHNVDRNQVEAYSPTLADKVALVSTRMSTRKIAEAIADELEKPDDEA